ncbi:MAG: flagellar biosynthesis protein FliQ [Lachnospiraceae bacterium]|nr:flagellar biosynthesis protein FliQ [Lachnospiraceae bacterium]
MTIETVVEMAKDALFLILQTASPLLLISLVVGLIVSIFQTVTSIQEQTLTFVPKIVSIFLGIILLGSWILNTIVEYMTQLWNDFAVYIR